MDAGPARAGSGLAAAPPRSNPSAPLTVVLGTLGTLLLATSTPLWRGATRGTWRLTLPLVPHTPHRFLAALLFIAASGSVVVAWWRLVATARNRSAPAAARTRLVVLALGAWWAPLLLGPPLLSNDVYSYVAQGTLASRGVDPTTVGPAALGFDPAFFQVDPVWASTPAPYGPTAITLSRVAVDAVGENPTAAVWTQRQLVVGAVALAGLGVVRLARLLGRDPATTLALAIANPLVTVHLVGGIHNDAWLLALVVWGFLAVRRGRRVLGFALLTAALGVKLTGAAAVLVLGWSWRPKPTALWRRAGDAVGALAAAVALLAIAGALTGVGLGWITALRSTGAVLTTFAPVTLVGLVLGWVLTTRPEGLVAPLRLAGLGLGGVLALRVLVRARRLGPELACALILMAGTLLGPVVWPWYLPVGLALLALAGPLRHLPAAMVVVSAMLLTVWPLSADIGVRVGAWQPALQLLAIAAVLAVAVRVQRREQEEQPVARGARAVAAR